MLAAHLRRATSYLLRLPLPNCPQQSSLPPRPALGAHPVSARCQALCLLRQKERKEALAKALAVKDRFKGVRTKYYVLKAYASTAEVVLKLLEDSQRFAALSDDERAAARRAMRGSRSRKSIVPALWADKGRGLTSPRGPNSPRGSGSRKRLTISDRVTGRLSRAPGGAHGSGSLGSAKEEEIMEDAAMLQDIALEWIDKIHEFGSIYPVAKPRALLLRGRYLVIQNKLKAGVEMLRKALAVAKTLQMPYEEGLAYFELGVNQKTDVEGARLFVLALNHFQLVGAAHDERRCARRSRDEAPFPLAERRAYPHRSV